MSTEVKIEPSWGRVLADEFQQPYFAALRAFLRQELAEGRTVYPPGPKIFEAFRCTPFDDVRVVILGQDPYHGPGQAHGLSFSVPPGVPPPPSLVNIFNELQEDLGLPLPHHGYLLHWAQQGVLLLNTTLTVRAHQAASHQNKGWERLTDAAIAALGHQRQHLVFMLWGSSAQQKGARIDPTRHLVLKAPHPSPLSAHRGFFGCRHFSQANAYLAQHGYQPIDWSLPTVA